MFYISYPFIYIYIHILFILLYYYYIPSFLFLSFPSYNFPFVSFPSIFNYLYYIILFIIFYKSKVSMKPPNVVLLIIITMVYLSLRNEGEPRFYNSYLSLFLGCNAFLTYFIELPKRNILISTVFTDLLTLLTLPYCYYLQV